MLRRFAWLLGIGLWFMFYAWVISFGLHFPWGLGLVLVKCAGFEFLGCIVFGV